MHVHTYVCCLAVNFTYCLVVVTMAVSHTEYNYMRTYCIAIYCTYKCIHSTGSILEYCAHECTCMHAYLLYIQYLPSQHTLLTSVVPTVTPRTAKLSPKGRYAGQQSSSVMLQSRGTEEDEDRPRDASCRCKRTL